MSVIWGTGVYLSSMARGQDDISFPVRSVISWWHCRVFLQTKWYMSIFLYGWVEFAVLSPWQYAIFIVYKIKCCVIDWYISRWDSGVRLSDNTTSQPRRPQREGSNRSRQIPLIDTSKSEDTSAVYFWTSKQNRLVSCGFLAEAISVIQSDSLSRGPKLLPIKNYVNQLTDDELTNAYYQQDGATRHTSNARMREIERFFFSRQNYLKKTFGHPDLPI